MLNKKKKDNIATYDDVDSSGSMPAFFEEIKRSGSELRWQFTFIVFLIIVSTLLLACLLTFVASSLGFVPLPRPSVVTLLVWFFLLSIFIGSALTVIVSNNFLKPLNTLSDAMSKVAGGDFSVRLQTNSNFHSVRRLSSDFNHMVYELSTVETLRNDFVSNVSHEFKTPLASIEGYAMLMQDLSLSREQLDEYVTSILFNTRRLSSLVGNILTISKIDTQSMPIEKSSYRLDEQVRQSILSLEQKWTEKQIEFEMNLDNTEFFGIEPLMNHVFLNLADNAIKFSPQKGTVYVDLADYEDRVEFKISNSGPRIPDEAMGRIFEKFYQGDTSHQSEGNGLGLALVKRIVKLHSGTITAKNTDDGLVEFSIVLPRIGCPSVAYPFNGRNHEDD